MRKTFFGHTSLFLRHEDVPQLVETLHRLSSGSRGWQGISPLAKHMEKTYWRKRNLRGTTNFFHCLTW